MADVRLINANALLEKECCGRISGEDVRKAPTIDPEDCRPQWISVEERLPDIAGFPVLMVAVNKFGQKKVVKGFTSYECPIEFLTNEKEYDLIWNSAWEVTHWMPLPEPPKGD